MITSFLLGILCVGMLVEIPFLRQPTILYQQPARREYAAIVRHMNGWAQRSFTIGLALRDLAGGPPRSLLVPKPALMPKSDAPYGRDVIAASFLNELSARHVRDASYDPRLSEAGLDAIVKGRTIRTLDHRVRVVVVPRDVQDWVLRSDSRNDFVYLIPADLPGAKP